MTETIRDESIDTVTVQNPKLGTVVATLYHVAERESYTKEHYRLEMVVSGKTHQCTMPTLAEGQARMAQLRAQA